MVTDSGENFTLPLEPPGGLDLRFCEVMDAAPVMIWVSREDTLCSWFNKPWLAFTGRTMAQELGNGWTQGVHPEDYDRCLQIYVSHFDARKEFRMQYRLQHHDGEYRWIDDIGIPRYAHDRKFLGYICLCTDIHASRAEDRLRQFESLVQGIKDYAIYMMDTEGSVVSWNTGAEHIKGYTAAEILGQKFFFPVFTRQPTKMQAWRRLACLQRRQSILVLRPNACPLQFDGPHECLTMTALEILIGDADSCLGIARLCRMDAVDPFYDDRRLSLDPHPHRTGLYR